jgi:hypothetical protein
VGSIAIAGGVAIAIVLVTRGSFRQLLALRIQSIWMAVLALGIQIALEFVDVPKDRIDDLGFGLLMGSYALLLAFCFVNLRVSGMWIVTLGIALNTTVIGLNQGMPTRDEEVTTSSGRTVEKPVERTVKHRPESGDDLLPFLGDQIVAPEPVDEVISVGDIVLAFDIVTVCYFGSRRRRPSRRAARTAAAARRLRREQATWHDETRPRLTTFGAELEQAYVRLSEYKRRNDQSANAYQTGHEDRPSEPGRQG